MEAKRGSAIQDSYSSMEHKFTPKNPSHVSRKEYAKIIKRFNELLAYYLITTGKMIYLPSKLGGIQMVRYKTTKPVMDKKKTRIAYGEYNKDKPHTERKYVYHMNQKTHGYGVWVYWHKHEANFRHKGKYRFTLTRPNIVPNPYNTNNPAVSLIPYFQKEGWMKYTEYNDYFRTELQQQSKDAKAAKSNTT